MTSRARCLPLLIACGLAWSAQAVVPTVLVLGRGKNDQTWLQGGGTITIKRGDVAINCPARDGLRIWGSAVLASSGHIGVFGGCSCGFKGRVEPQPELLGGQFDDPYASLKVEPPAEIVGTNLKIDHGTRAVLKPGRYEGGLEIGNNCKVEFQPGVHYLSNGPLNIGMGAELDGKDVTIVLGGEKPGVVSSAPWSKTDLAGPTKGPLKGMVLISYGGKGTAQPWHWLKGYTKLQGTVYVPNGAVQFWTDKPVIVTRVVCFNLGIFTKEMVIFTGEAPPKTDAPPEDAVPPAG